MVDELQLLRGVDIVVNETLTLRQPTLKEICDYGETKYFSLVSALCATPSDYKLPLWDQFGLNWETVDELEFFSILCQAYSVEDTRILLGEFPLGSLRPARNNQNGERILAARQNGEVYRLDSALYLVLTDYLRRVHGLVKTCDRAGNAASRQYLLDKERRRFKRRRPNHNGQRSVLAPLISSMVNCEQFKYDHCSVWNLPLYPFLDSVRRIQKLKHYDQIMHGVYAGTVDLKKLPQESLNWMGDAD